MESSLRARIVALALLAVVATGYKSPPSGSRDVVPHSSPSGSELRVDSPSMREISAAMFSVYAKLIPLPASEQLRQLEPIPLEDAARILKRDAESSLPGKSRLRRAVVRLTVAGLEVNADKSFRLAYRGFLEAVLEVFHLNVRDIEMIVEGKIGEVVRPGARLTVDLLEPELSQSLYQKLSTADLAAWCVSTLPQTVIQPDQELIVEDDTYRRPSSTSPACSHPADWQNGTAYVRTVIGVTRDLSELRKALDPLSWDVCDAASGKRCSYFAETLALKADRSRYDDCQSGSPSPGSGWDGEFYESLIAPWDFLNKGPDPTSGQCAPINQGTGPASHFNVFLDVTTQIAPDPYRVDLCLDDGYAFISGTDANNGIIDVDEGFSHTQIGTSQKWVTAEKWLRFAGYTVNNKPVDALLNAHAQTLISMMGEGLQEQACCRVESCPMGPPTSPVLIP
jgi:hypothetical protein